MTISRSSMGSQLTGNRRMALTEKGKKIRNEMRKKYGSKRGDQVFYASANKGTITGVEEGMKKKSVKKMSSGGKSLLGSLSPVYGIATGEGLFGKIGAGGALGAVGKLIERSRDDDEEKKEGTAGDAMKATAMNAAARPATMAATAAPRAMKRGGSTGRSRPIDGIAVKGKTKGRMC
jgi:hypothetical protein